MERVLIVKIGSDGSRTEIEADPSIFNIAKELLRLRQELEQALNHSAELERQLDELNSQSSQIMALHIEVCYGSN